MPVFPESGLVCANRANDSDIPRATDSANEM